MNWMVYSTFEQFEIQRLIPIHPFGNLDISITNSTIFMLLAVSIFYWIYVNSISNGNLIPGRWQSVIELIYINIYNVIKDNIGSSGARFFPLIFTIFVFIAFMNIIGIIPYTFTPTSHIVVTFGLSLSIFFAVTILGIINYQTNYFSMFLPGGSPLILAPFLVVIELVSHIAKAISLGVRLAANITAGHLLFAILSGFVWKMLIAGGLLSILSIFPMLIVIFITILEIAVALIQAYVFSLLTTIYINESIHLH